MNMHELVDWFQRTQPHWVAAMKATNHHLSQEMGVLNPYHLEGDVWTHTMMVCRQAQDMSFEVRVAALLHDLGKVQTREVTDKQRVRFFQHEPLSAFEALPIMDELGLSMTQKIHIFQLIALHTEPFKLTEEKLDSRMVGNFPLYRDLIDLNRADREGRFYFQGEVEEIKPKILDTPRINYDGPSCILMVGVPGSGKSTYAKMAFPELPILSRDEIINELGTSKHYAENFNSVNQDDVDKILNQRRSNLIKERQSFVLDMTNLSRRARRRTLANLPKDYVKQAVVMLTGLGEVERRIAKRSIIPYPPPHVVDKMLLSFYPPMFDEFDVIDWRIE